MTDADFDYIVALIKKESGIIITKDKDYLLESRLMPIVRANNFVTLEDLFMALRNTGKGSLLNQVIDAMTTNESFFFRDVKPFTQFEEIVLPYLMQTKANNKSLRIWSAAASSGQEAYSLAMLLKERSAQLAGWNIEIIATDISSEILTKAMSGVYSQFEVQRGLPVQFLVKYFKKNGDNWLLDKSIVSMVQFKKWNLLDDLTPLGRFDVVFCRNVLIYFDQATKSGILSRIRNLLPKDGFLYLGGAETVLGICDGFRGIQGQRGIYVCNTNESTAIDNFVKGSTGAPAPVTQSATPLPSASLRQPAPDMSSVNVRSPKPQVSFTPAVNPASPIPQSANLKASITETTEKLAGIMKSLQTEHIVPAPKSASPSATSSTGSTEFVSKGLTDAMASLQKILNKNGANSPQSVVNPQSTLKVQPATVTPTNKVSPVATTHVSPAPQEVTTPGKMDRPPLTVEQIFAALKEKQEALKEASRLMNSGNPPDQK